MFARSTLVCLAVLLGISLAGAADRELYVTDFEGFPTGEDRLFGTDGWTGTNQGQNVHGIDDGAAPNLGKTGFLGANSPRNGTESVSIFRPLDNGTEPATGEVRFEVLFGITTSFEGGDDIFSFSFLNDDDEFLAAIVFDTTDEDFGVWTDNGDNATHTGELFFTEFLHTLTATVNLATNRWSAALDGIPVFENIRFTATNDTRNIGSVAAEWVITNENDPGDNWLLFDDWSLVSMNEPDQEPEPEPGENFRIGGISIDQDGGRRIQWEGVDRVRYQIQYSADGITWKDDLPDSLVTASDSTTTLNFVDGSSISGGHRLYRVVWLGTTP